MIYWFREKNENRESNEFRVHRGAHWNQLIIFQLKKGIKKNALKGAEFSGGAGVGVIVRLW